MGEKKILVTSLATNATKIVAEEEAPKTHRIITVKQLTFFVSFAANASDHNIFSGECGADSGGAKF